MQSALGCQIGNNALQFVQMKVENELGEKIRVLRRSKFPELTIEKLADLAELSRQAMGAIEKGRTKKPSFHTISKIAKALGVSLDTILGDIKIEQVAESRPVYGSRKASLKKEMKRMEKEASIDLRSKKKQA